ncbi:class I SAM-dependent methyltransferase [Methylomonas sp. AM2-LC]|uniref:class I SAM-dependent methyltransferase n=1 Tax=Methylomonas sp. AM2-LC TaxID=3153301 RepID=UPI0032634D13
MMPSNSILNSENSLMPCNLCENHDVSILGTRSRSGNPLRTVICKHCGLVWSDPFPHDPKHFYAEEYRLNYKNTYSPKSKHVLRAGKVALGRYQKIKHLLEEKKTILDVGTGGGEFAYLLKSSGHELFGIEPNKGYAEYSVAEYGLNLHIGFIQDSQFSLESFDLITIWHVLEHTEDPFFVLCKLRDLLKPQGVLVVEVPNIEATCQTPKSTFHEAHLFNFNLETLVKMGLKAGLIAQKPIYSEDRGNMTLLFSKALDCVQPAESWFIADNAERISHLVKNHTNLNHFFSTKPYIRFLKRMYRSVSEKVYINRLNKNKRLLDQIYQNAGHVYHEY